MTARFSRLLPFIVVALGASPACRAKRTAGDTAAAAPSAAPSAGAPGGEVHAVSDEQVRQALNPDGEKAYSGPIGSVRGTVRVSGPSAPERADVLGRIPAKTCDDARAFYGKLFREGPGRELGDVLVAVTGYKGYLPPSGPAKSVVARGCAFDSRTIAMVFGQRLEVSNRSGETFIPRLVGAKQAALVVAVPGGDSVKLFPSRVGQYQLADQTHDFAVADLFVLKFPTFAVTGLDGKFEIQGIPAGEVTLSAYLPATQKTFARKVNVVAGEVTTLDVTLPFDGSMPAPAASGKP